MIVYPNAKINLGLRILSKRPDGFHDIETLFYPVGWSDILEILPSGFSSGIRFKISGIPLPGCSKDNLIYKAASLMQERYDLPGIRIHLHKQIPVGAGLGGGSSDAAFTLKTIQRLFSLDLSFHELHQLAAQLGSDCAFFLVNKPALASGKGEKLTPVSLDLHGIYVLIIFPGFTLDTGRMYNIARISTKGMSLKEAITKPRNEWKKYLINHFEEPLSRDFPVIQKLLKHLYASGAWFASVSGSGSSVYGLFDAPPRNLSLPQNYQTWSEQL
ncbi:MAG TPA: 4-(cytidine 5'-diphospho)-2-C-methyl-D-erythritol kinase [Bacteroidetes bacterium]|nr:4-(cytidine 5'-diphospho)-2-C-methyl-D-erythritol kinase [Bacteroidota bacterium]